MKNKQTKILQAIKKNTITLEEFSQDTTPEERRLMDREKKYYQIVVALKKTREDLGLTQKTLASRANLPRTTITKVESGSRNTTLQTLMTMAQAMGKRLDLRLL